MRIKELERKPMPHDSKIRGRSLDGPFVHNELVTVVWISRYWDLCQVKSVDGNIGEFWWYQLAAAKDRYGKDKD